MAPYPALPVGGNGREGGERGGGLRDEDRNERERVKGGATSSGNSSLPFRSRDYLGNTRSPQTVPAGCSAFVWTRVKRDSIERKTVTGTGANKISRYNNIGAHRLARPTGRSNKPCDWSAANPKFTRPSATILRFVPCPTMPDGSSFHLSKPFSIFHPLSLPDRTLPTIYDAVAINNESCDDRFPRERDENATSDFTRDGVETLVEKWDRAVSLIELTAR